MNKPKFNFIDALIILAAVLVICAGVLFLNGRRAAAGGSAPVGVEYKIQLTQIRKPLADAFTAAMKNGETVYVSDKERAAATLVDVEVGPARKITTDTSDGRTYWTEIDGYYDVVLTLRSEGSDTDSQINAGSVPIRVGEEMAVKGKGIAGYGFVTNLELVK